MMRAPVLMVTTLVMVMFFIAFFAGEQIGMQKGKTQAMKEALRTNPPSEELEMVCAGLWIGQQNKKYWEKENASKSK